MSRVVKTDEYAAKRDQILDAALQVMYTRGSEQMTIQDILDRLGISKGAFYHYFSSKQAVLEALVERMGEETERSLLPVFQDPTSSAIQKIKRYLEVSEQGKRQQMTLITSLLRVWYSEENVVIRQKFYSESLEHLSRLLEPVIRQGIAEGSFNTRFPEQAALIISGVALSLSDTFVELLLSPTPIEEANSRLETAGAAYIDAIERVLGAPEGALVTFEPGAFKDWFSAARGEGQTAPPAAEVNIDRSGD